MPLPARSRTTLAYAQAAEIRYNACSVRIQRPRGRWDMYWGRQALKQTSDFITSTPRRAEDEEESFFIS
jgi:hypothetical protein